MSEELYLFVWGEPSAGVDGNQEDFMRDWNNSGVAAVVAANVEDARRALREALVDSLGMDFGETDSKTRRAAADIDNEPRCYKLNLAASWPVVVAYRGIG